ncbi:MAG: glycosyltransferase family 4 protein [Chloroflexi bacterium]|nr:glycosyltransferase family 4 protein [Chloroflexota bacterium]
MTRICIYPRVESMGGVGSFRLKFAEGLKSRGIEVSYDLNDPQLDFILVLAGTKNLIGLYRARKRGIPIIQRLDGINWVQRKRWTGFRYHLRAEYGNANLAFIRRFLADKVVYQSEFTHQWWEDWYGETRVPYTVIHNAVDLDMYKPVLQDAPAAVLGGDVPDKYRLLLVEGSLAGGLDSGLRWGVELAEKLSKVFPIELLVVGRVDEKRKSEILSKTKADVKFLGVVPREEIPEIDRSAHLYFSAEVNPPCPNAVIEALACGLPVLGFDTGSLSELVPPIAGKTVPYGGDQWKLEEPDISALTEAAAKIITNLAPYRVGARQHAEENLGLEMMVDKYLDFLLAQFSN